MAGWDYRDIVGGALLVFIGAGAAIYAWANYRLGTIMHMGPGMFPAALGVLLAGLGAVVLLPALFRSGAPLPRPALRPFVFILLSLLAFALTVRWLGLVPAIVLLTITSVLADNKMGVIGTIVLAATLSAVAWLVFGVGLGIPLQAIKWPAA
jgi:Tripartite tricarboxylate transporter TctB family